MSSEKLDIDAVREATDGVRAAYFVHPTGPSLLEATATFADAAEDAGGDHGVAALLQPVGLRERYGSADRSSIKSSRICVNAC